MNDVSIRNCVGLQVIGKQIKKKRKKKKGE